MKLARSLVVKIEDAEFEFEKPKGNERIGKLSKPDLITFVFSKLKKVTGLQEEDGSDVKVEALRTLELPDDYVEKILAGFIKEYLILIGVKEVPEEKKSSETA